MEASQLLTQEAIRRRQRRNEVFAELMGRIEVLEPREERCENSRP